MNKLIINPCMKCGNKDIEIYDCGYSSFNAGHAKCKKCGNGVNANNLSCIGADHELVSLWNKSNLSRQQQIKFLEKQIAQMTDSLEEAKTDLEKLRQGEFVPLMWSGFRRLSTVVLKPKKRVVRVTKCITITCCAMCPHHEYDNGGGHCEPFDKCKKFGIILRDSDGTEDFDINLGIHPDCKL